MLNSKMTKPKRDLKRMASLVLALSLALSLFVVPKFSQTATVDAATSASALTVGKYIRMGTY